MALTLDDKEIAAANVGAIVHECRQTLVAFAGYKAARKGREKEGKAVQLDHRLFDLETLFHTLGLL